FSDNLTEIDETKMETKMKSREATENYLRKQFGEIYSKDDSKDEIIIKTDDRIAEVNLSTLEVKTDDDILRNRITQYYARYQTSSSFRILS
ncbi:3926_t:CDS:2, partial [Dentiscutata heterogama]